MHPAYLESLWFKSVKLQPDGSVVGNLYFLNFPSASGNCTCVGFKTETLTPAIGSPEISGNLSCYCFALGIKHVWQQKDRKTPAKESINFLMFLIFE